MYQRLIHHPFHIKKFKYYKIKITNFDKNCLQNKVIVFYLKFLFYFKHLYYIHTTVDYFVG